ncbi:cobalamin biosynthesis protein [Desulfatitalea alkaliphila]|uniref:Cobalamin biosynthesis protein n=1 Tax=Desulfatitalea alkaliphila TaxID=2929485 RepID=A0AA41R6C6_9BACT|nr:cobalamin biosynthesis protein [Desulfatitalea alkaliphila]MCJ8499943.1 cobalamin biosynthesis protein [Desulfatitalea alkaliphila]
MIALVTLSATGAELAATLHRRMAGSALYIHSAVAPAPADAERFERSADLLARLFATVDGIVFIGPCGVAVRAIAPCLQDKYSDPAVVVLDVGARHAISLLSGHEGGANDLALTVANILGAEPVVTTTTEAEKRIIVGVGCRRGCSAEAIAAAVRVGLARAGTDLTQVRYLASADIKADEPGLAAAARQLKLPLRLIASEAIRNCTQPFNEQALVKEKVNLPGVAEPAALLAGRRTRLILPRIIHNQVTVAVAREE